MSDSTSSALCAPPRLFDRSLVRLHRQRSARLFDKYSFLKKRTAEDLAERLDHMEEKFERIVDIGAHTGQATLAARPWTTTGALVIHCDLAEAFALRAPAESVGLVADEEKLPLADNSFDLVISCLSLHWVNDLVACLIRIRSILRPGGLFIGAMAGGDTLCQLRQCLIAAESHYRPDGVPLRISPFVRTRDLASLLMQTGFRQPVSDCWSIDAHYEHPINLLHDLRGMGETAAPAVLPPPLDRSILALAMDFYRRDFPDIPARFEVITATGRAP